MLIGTTYSIDPTNLKNNKPVHFCFDENFNPSKLPRDIEKELLSYIKKNQKDKLGIEIVWSEVDGKFEIKFSKEMIFSDEKLKKIVASKISSKEFNEIIKNLNKEQVEHWFISSVNEKLDNNDLIFDGESLVLGAGSGTLLTTREDVKLATDNCENIIWACKHVATEDLELFNKVDGIILTESGKTSHAGVVVKGFGTPTIVLEGWDKKLDKYLNKKVTLNATSGELYKGNNKINKSSVDNDTKIILQALAKQSDFEIEANVDKAVDAKKASEIGVQSIGLCRTEHMFTTENRAKLVRRILEGKELTEKQRKELIKDLGSEFGEIFKNMSKRVVVRFLDAPLHEFLPDSKETNPMLGFRGIRMLLKRPELIEILTESTLVGLSKVIKTNPKFKLCIEAPLVIDFREVEIFKELIFNHIKTLRKEKLIKNIEIGSMIETPRSLYSIDKISNVSDFISFGTNDLTQMFFGISRDDSGNFINDFIENKIIENDPFVSLDKEVLIPELKKAVQKVKKANPNIHISVCGEQAGDSETINLLKGIGVDSVSISVSRIPVARFSVA